MPAGKPKKFKNGAHLISLFREFCDEIIDQNFSRVPNQTNFCKWLEKHFDECNRRTIYNALNKYFPTVKKEFEKIQSDVIAEGGMLGKYQSTMSIFALKNWCKWQDKPPEEPLEKNTDDGLLDIIKQSSKEVFPDE